MKLLSRQSLAVAWKSNAVRNHYFIDDCLVMLTFNIYMFFNENNVY